MKPNKLQIAIGALLVGSVFFSFSQYNESKGSGERSKRATSSDSKNESTAIASAQKAETAQQAVYNALEARNKLTTFSTLHTKTFRSPAEESQIKEWTYSPLFLQRISLMLLDSANPLTPMEADAAVDLLIEALKMGDQKFALRTILEVIRDDQVENTELPENRRRDLAAAKAELMYHAVNIDPQTIEEMLPGPVSRRIWRNVKQNQNHNLQQSEEEKRAIITSQR